MPSVPFTAALRDEYQRLFDTCQVNAGKAAEVDAVAVKIIAARNRYEAVGGPAGVPWYVIAAIHAMECSLDFRKHLHNGDPLTGRTTHVPKGRPSAGTPPFTWEDSAADAIALDRFPDWTDWTIPGLLYAIERFNGWGYRLYHPDVKSPYLWAGTNHYTSGKYVADGTWSATATSRQCGASAILRRLAEKGQIDADPEVTDDEFEAFANASGTLAFAPDVVTPGGASLQHYLNRFPGIYLKEDGKLGPRTSDAFRRIFGRYLAGDPRGN